MPGLVEALRVWRKGPKTSVVGVAAGGGGLGKTGGLLGASSPLGAKLSCSLKGLRS